mmetsp:Transcript_26953/g.48933  ORF Transcript_26953/g.48933 Transcript_26953/m.48933 type:complete len:244 (-) Transcript_26953:232-963(-)
MIPIPKAVQHVILWQTCNFIGTFYQILVERHVDLLGGLHFWFMHSVPRVVECGQSQLRAFLVGYRDSLLVGFLRDYVNVTVGNDRGARTLATGNGLVSSPDGDALFVAIPITLLDATTHIIAAEGGGGSVTVTPSFATLLPGIDAADVIADSPLSEWLSPGIDAATLSLYRFWAATTSHRRRHRDDGVGPTTERNDNRLAGHAPVVISLGGDDSIRTAPKRDDGRSTGEAPFAAEGGGRDLTA